jgi:N-acetyl-anhydromuramyl-L-alanine amidase AmpD/peptidoglycan/xylan/chitin deacetylase (PgdA/CDA1 family)
MLKIPTTVKLIHLLVLAALVLSACSAPSPTLTPPPSALPAATSTPTLTPSPSPSLTPSATSSPVPTETATASLTPTPTLIPAAQIPIIEYHDPDFRLNDQVQMTIPWFQDQMRWLADNGYRTLDGDEMAAYLDGTQTFPQKSVMLTFDLGTAKKPIYTDSVIPTLQKYNFKAVFFILANDSVVGDDCSKPKVFCWGDFIHWADQGVITIASHGLYHPDFTKITNPEIKYEVETARILLQEKTGHLPVGFAFPFDTINPAAPNIVKAAGYQFAVAGNSRKVLAVTPNDPDRYKLPRVYPYSNTAVYPNLTGYTHPFGTVIANLTQPGLVVAGALTTPSPLPDGGSTADKVVQYCKTLSTEPTLRLTALMQSSFTSDLSPEAQAALPGLTTSISCNIPGKNKPEAIVIHYTVGDLTASMYGFRQTNGTSSHYLIDRDGKVVQMVPEDLAALHASCTNTRGNCVPSCPICDDSNGNLTEPYTRSIGIELVNRGHLPAGTTAPNGVYEDYLRSYSYPYWEEYTPAQVASLKVLVTDIAKRWNIPIDDQHVIGHYRINQKVDPGPALNLFWSRSGNPPRDPIFAPTPKQP